MKMFQIPVGQMQNFCYIFADEKTGSGCLIDPAFDHKIIMNHVLNNSLKIARIVLTHHHYDHINATTEIRDKTGAEVLCHRETVPLLPENISIDHFIDEDFEFHIEESLVRCIHTPGHAPGSLCLIIEDKWLVTADTLFIGDCGRADLKGSDPRALFSSLQKLKQLPDHLIVCPGHDYGKSPTRTLGEEKGSNPALLAASFEEFITIP